MASKLIQLKDGTLVEVEVSENEARQISSREANAVEATFEKIKPVLRQAVQPIAEIWEELNRDVELESATVEIGFSFEGEGNIYVTKAKAGANVAVTLTLKPKP